MTDPSLLSSEELVELLFRYVDPADPDAVPLISEVGRRLTAKDEDVFVLPVSVTEAVRQHFGGGRRTFDAITKRVRFAYKVWQDKYGPWNLEQAEYAEELCLWAINRAATAPNANAARPIVYSAFDRLLNHEDTHAGFGRRAGAFVNIAAELEEVV